MVKAAAEQPILAAIDVGANAVRLKLARPLPDGSLETLHEERDPVRPGEGVFKTGTLPRDVADRLLSTLRRYAALCRRHRAQVRAVATSAMREAKNAGEVIRRVREEAGLELDVVSGKEEARLICVGVLFGKAPGARSLVIDIGGGSTEVASALGERPTALWTLALGAVRLSELFDTSGKISGKQLGLLRGYASEVIGEALPRRIAGAPRIALGSSGTIKAVVGFAAAEGTGHATARQLSRAVEELADMGPDGRRKRFDPRRADIIVPGAVILEGLAHHLGLHAITAVEGGLRDGLLVDLMRRRRAPRDDHSLADAAIAMGLRFFFDERHARQVAFLALELFDRMAPLHGLPASARELLEVAALLHDVGHAVSYQRHHKHAYYLIQNADLPGLADRQRELVARVARYHRRSPPDPAHIGMVGLSRSEIQLVRKLATILRIADSLDRSHHQPVKKAVVRLGRDVVAVRLRARVPLDLELWDVARESQLFRHVFGKRIDLTVARS
ncbi:MAG TPA: Ppx/GppA phosphatase family protein [Polyangia bacterium]|nr:Ppx/GppA phosphatase family protein [Polyangia bacterium]